jgi:predicted glutamine amidotransferase
MCGIAFKANFENRGNVNKAIIKQYKRQQWRGRQGFGLFSYDEDKQRGYIVKEAKEDNILRYLKKNSHRSKFIMFHHRFPTSTINVAEAAHPHSTYDYFGNVQYVLVHNGVIRNAADLFAKHQELGIEYRSFLSDLTFNDSESLLWDFALTMEGKQKEMTAKGDMAFICMKLIDGKLDRMYFGRNNRPLNLYRDKDTIELSSEGRGESIQDGWLYTWNYQTKRLTKRVMEFPLYQPFRSSNIPKYIPPHQRSGNPGWNACGYSAPAITSSDGREYDDMDEYWRSRAESIEENSRRQKAESNWQRLRKKFGPKVTEDIETRKFNSNTGATRVAEILTEPNHIFEAKENEDGTYSVVAVRQEVAKSTIDVDEVMKNRKDYEPTVAEVQSLAMQYLIEAEGVFENAYALMEFEYTELVESLAEAPSFQGIRDQLCMEKAMEFIMSDPEYINETSVSSVAEALWFQQIQQTQLAVA